MGYADYIRALLRPLRVYALDGGFEDMETEVLGEELDRIGQALEVSEREMLPLTAESYGLTGVLSLLARQSSAGTTEQMQKALCALLSISDDSFTIQSHNDTLRGCGIPAAVRETGQPGVVEVSFPENGGEPEGMDALHTIIEDILPCHLQVDYFFRYVTRQRLESLFADWNALEVQELT